MQAMVIKGAILESITCKYSLKLLTGLHLNSFHAKGDNKQYYSYYTPHFALDLKKTTKLKQLDNISKEADWSKVEKLLWKYTFHQLQAYKNPIMIKVNNYETLWISLRKTGDVSPWK